ncbi:transposase [Streptomyces sp. GMY02]|uniref:transposase n=1 Tax=Streptomyces sp. GMY02 TaxID=1333528 RepID=UPI0020B86014|nr:transposase [Streptomyces sp. GMY02]
MAAGHNVDPARWRATFDNAMTRIAGRFRRVEPRATARAYLLGLLSGVERKDCWRLAEQDGHARPRPMQRLLRSARWDADAVRDDVRARAMDHLGAEGGGLIVHETGFTKKGCASAGVQRDGRRLLHAGARGHTLVRVDSVTSRLPLSDWHRQSAGAGAKGPRLGGGCRRASHAWADERDIR